MYKTFAGQFPVSIDSVSARARRHLGAADLLDDLMSDIIDDSPKAAQADSPSPADGEKAGPGEHTGAYAPGELEEAETVVDGGSGAVYSKSLGGLPSQAAPEPSSPPTHAGGGHVYSMGHATSLNAVDEALERKRRSLLDVLARLEAQIATVLEERTASEHRAERLLIIGGAVVILLPVVLIAAYLMGRVETLEGTILSGLSAAGFAGLMFGPGREIRKAAKDRNALTLLPLGFHLRMTAASTHDEMKAIAADLAQTLRALSVPGGG